jgi:molybdopterin synthase catalytic subunit
VRSGVIVAGITETELSAADLLHDIGTAADGAVVVFEGRVRDHNEGMKVVGLHYDGYPEMADEVLGQIAGEAIEKYEVSTVGVRHRIGNLAPGEVSLVVAVSAGHRGPAYEASRFVIEELKVWLPIWKKEVYADGSTGWLEGQAASGPAEPEGGP